MGELQFVPDWATHEFCWMAWAVHPEWGRAAREVKQELRKVISTISEYETVRLLTPRHLLAEAKGHLFGPNVEIVEAPVDDIWMRDIAPIYARSGNEVIPIDLNFNGWGATRFRKARPGDRLAGIARSLFGSIMINAPFVAEGGAFVVGHDEVVFTTRSCLLNPNRNPHLREFEIETALIRLGASKVVWLNGDSDEKITSGHIDGYVLPSESGEILVQRADVRDSFVKTRNSDIETLQSARTTNGNAIRLQLVRPPRVATRRGEFFAAGYLNVYTPNSAVVAPRFNDELRDEEARLSLKQAFPGREIKILSIPHLASGGGGIRCLVQPVPSA